MASLLVGDNGCTFLDIIRLVKGSPTSHFLCKKWKELARALDIDLATREGLEQAILLGSKQNMDAFENILREWRSRTANEATLEKLLNLVEEAGDLQELAGMLRCFIRTKAEKWNDLDEKSKETVLQCPMEFFERRTSFHEMGRVLGREKMNEILEKTLERNTLNKALGGALWTLEKDSQDEQLPYYIPRTLTLQRELCPDIFRVKCRDIFTFEGIRRSDLSILTQHKGTDVSSNQGSDLAVRFILLELPQDFETLCQKKTDAPVHRISCEKGRYYWVSTVGSVKLIREHLMGKTEDILELEMVTRGLFLFNSRPIAVADIPGMGKSVLLSELARKAKEIYPDRYILTVSLPKFLSFLPTQADPLPNVSEVKRQVAKYATTSPLSQEILFEFMNTISVKFEVFMDSFDEVPSSQLPLVKQLLQMLMHSHNLRGIIATRTYVQDDLEQTVGVISWNIKPFVEADRTEFFLRYWTSTLQLENPAQLEKFTAEFVAQLRVSEWIFDDNENANFAGVPLQCYMLAHLYSDEVKRHCSSSTPLEFEITPKISTLQEMYKQFMEFRFEGVAEPEMRILKEAHWTAAVNLIFPEWVDTLQDAGLLEPVEFLASLEDPKRLLSFGILQTVNPLKFVHRTFAEYLVADFVVARMIQEIPTPPAAAPLLQFFFEAVLSSRTTARSVSVHSPEISPTIFPEFVAVLKDSSIWPRIPAEYERMKSVLSMEHTYRAKYKEEESLLNILSLWSSLHGEAKTYDGLVKLFGKELDWPGELIDALLRVPSVLSRDYQHPLICLFLDAFLNAVDTKDFDKMRATKYFEATPGGPSGASTQLFAQSTMGVSRGFSNLFALLKSILDPLVNYPHLRGAHPWPSLVVAAARKDLSIFQPVCELVEKIYDGMDLFQLDYPHSKRVQGPQTPLHEAVAVGNYPVVDYLIGKYQEDKSVLSTLRGLLFLAFSFSIKNPLSMVLRKLEIIRLLIHTGTGDLSTESVSVRYATNKEKRLVRVTATRPHVKLFMELITLAGGLNLERFIDSRDFVDSTLRFYTGDEMEELVGFLAEKELLGLLFQWEHHNYTGIQTCIMANNLGRAALQNIQALHKFSLADMGDTFYTFEAVLRSQRQPEMVKTLVEMFDCVNFREERWDSSLLMMAAKSHCLASMRYLVEAGADVTAFSRKGWSPLQGALNVEKKSSVDLNLVHDCVEFLLESGADVNAENGYGRTVLDQFERLNVGKVIPERTIRLLVAKADKSRYTFKEGAFQRMAHCVLQ